MAAIGQTRPEAAQAAVGRLKASEAAVKDIHVWAAQVAVKQRRPIMDEGTLNTPTPKCRLYWSFFQVSRACGIPQIIFVFH